MTGAIHLPWQPSQVASLCRDLDLPGPEGAYPHRQVYPDLDMSDCIFYATTPVESLADAIRHEVLHWADGPAVRWYLRDGSLANEQWWFYGQMHRFDGPAFISYLQRGGEFRQWAEEGEVLRTERT